MLLLLLPAGAKAQAPPDTAGLHPARLWGGLATFALADAAALVALDRLWYAGYDRAPFHWYDDTHEYAQMDKGGHLLTSWQLTRVFSAYGRWAGLERAEAAWAGAALAFAFQGQIEVLDGTSAAWGASAGDLLANAAGSLLGGVQEASSEAPWLGLKYSYHPSPYRDPALGLAGNALKDYDGITYWAVVRPGRVLPEHVRWPAWLAVAVGYGGDGLAGPVSGRAKGGQPGPEHRRQLYLSLDLDVLAQQRWRQPWRTVGRMLSFVRVPAPALELGARTRWHWLYY